MKGIKRLLIGLVMVVLLAVMLVPRIVPATLEPTFNTTHNPPPYPVSEQALQLHDQLIVADMHADSLLWRRDLLQQSDRGHVDVPRLIAGNVAVQGFTIVTKSPEGQNEDHNSADTDRITKLVMVQGWPPRTWNSRTERALYQIEKLHHFAEQSDGLLQVVESRAELDAFLADYNPQTSSRVAGWLGIEGAHALDGELANLQRLFDAGLRTVGIAHFFDNRVGGSAHGMDQHGLTELGKQVVTQSQQLGILIDLAHASQASIHDVLAMTTKPVMVSHTGVRGTCNNNRNLSDELLQAIARAGADQGGSVIGIGFWPKAVCGTEVSAIIDAIDYTVKQVGVDHVGLGSDFDGSVGTPFDATGMAKITEGLLARGYSEVDIGKIMGGNLLRVLRATLP